MNRTAQDRTNIGLISTEQTGNLPSLIDDTILDTGSAMIEKVEQ